MSLTQISHRIALHPWTKFWNSGWGISRNLLFATGLISVVAASGQTKVDLSVQGKVYDFSNAPSTRPFRAGNALPITCTSGETFYLVTATPGANLYACTSTNQWTQISGSSVPSPIGNSGKVLSNDGTSLNWQSIGGDVSGPVASQIVQGLRGVPVAATAPADGQILAFSGTLNRWEPKSASGNALAAWPVTRNSDTVLAVGTGPGLRIGETYCQVPSTSASIQISGGTGTLFMFIRPSCELVVAHNLTVSNCTNCTAVEGTGYEVNSFPLASWTATDGVLAAIGISAVTPYGIRPLLAGQNVQFTHSGGSTQINTFSSGVNLGDKALTFEWNNSTAFATVRGRLASWAVDAGNAVVQQTAFASPGHVGGLVIAGAGNTGKARLAIRGIAQCEFENNVAALDWVVPGTTQNGLCRSAGATKPSSGVIVGRVLQTGAAGSYPVLVELAQ